LEEDALSQSERFARKARELGCDEDPEVFERVFGRVVPPKVPPEPQSQRAKGTATKRSRRNREKVKPEP
jgi:hypothetical protein